MSNVLTVTNPTRLWQRQHTLVDYIRSSRLAASIRTALRLRALRFLRHFGHVGRKNRELRGIGAAAE
jgi:hypothetical protein